MSIPAPLQWENPLGHQTVMSLAVCNSQRFLPGRMSWVPRSRGWLKSPCLEMNPKNLLPILAFLSQIPVPLHNEALDAVPWIGVYSWGQHILHWKYVKASCCTLQPSLQAFPKNAKVEICAGDANLSRALQRCGLKTKAFDVSWQNNDNCMYMFFFVWGAKSCCKT